MRGSILLFSLMLSGCGSINSVVANYQPLCPGTRPYDPQICRGETWQRFPNFINEAKMVEQRCGSIGAHCPGVQK